MSISGNVLELKGWLSFEKEIRVKELHNGNKKDTCFHERREIHKLNKNWENVSPMT